MLDGETVVSSSAGLDTIEEPKEEVVEQGAEESGQTEQKAEFDRLDKHPRFQEVYQKMKDYENKLSEYERRMNEKSTQPTEDPDLALLVKMGFGEKEASQLLKIFENRTEKSISPLKEQATSQQIDFAFKSFFAKHDDIDDKLGAKMNEIFEGFSREEQKILSKNTKSLEMLYAQAKNELGTDYEKGKSDASRQAKEKKAGGSFKGSPSGNDNEISESDIENMSPEEYQKKSEKIYAKFRRLKAEEIG